MQNTHSRDSHIICLNLTEVVSSTQEEVVGKLCRKEIAPWQSMLSFCILQEELEPYQLAWPPAEWPWGGDGVLSLEYLGVLTVSIPKRHEVLNQTNTNSR